MQFLSPRWETDPFVRTLEWYVIWKWVSYMSIQDPSFSNPIYCESPIGHLPLLPGSPFSHPLEYWLLRLREDICSSAHIVPLPGVPYLAELSAMYLLSPKEIITFLTHPSPSLSTELIPPLVRKVFFFQEAFCSTGRLILHNSYSFTSCETGSV